MAQPVSMFKNSRIRNLVNGKNIQEKIIREKSVWGIVHSENWIREIDREPYHSSHW